MRSFDAATLNYLQQPGGKEVRVLAHVWARRRIDGVIEGMGLWSGSEDRLFTIRGVTRTYYRAAGMMAMDEVIMAAGTDTALTNFSLSPIDQAVRTMIGNYNLRYAPVEIHRALFWPDSGDLVAEPHRVFKGWIDGAPEDIGAVGESHEFALQLASANQILTRTLPFKKSDGALSAARSGDRFRRYTDIGTAITPWGEARAGAPPQANPFLTDILNRSGFPTLLEGS